MQYDRPQISKLLS